MARRRQGRGRGAGPRSLDRPREVEIDVHPDVLLDAGALRDAAARAARVAPGSIGGTRIERRSIDARRGKVRIHARVAIAPEPLPDRDRPEPVDLPTRATAPTVAIVGAGPAGMFCAWGLARAGIRSVIVERGKRVRARRRDLAALSQRGELDAESNYCFGEGGAGTFSDGKLYTRAHKRGPVREVLEALASYGAPLDILVNARPHIGTNRLPRVITAMREHLEAAGVEFRFEARATGLRVEDGAVRGLELADGSVLDVPHVVVAPGHSAPDVLDWLDRAGVQLAPKSFAMGVRIEHPQPLVDRIQLGELAGHPALGAASYRLVEQIEGAGVFSFCMCPGGYIVAASTQPGQQVVNGLSPSQRRGRFANSGFVTEVGPDLVAGLGHDPGDWRSGLTVQAGLERRAFEAGGGAYVAPAQTLADFVARRPSTELPETSYHRGLRSADLDAVLGPLAAPLRGALERLGPRMPGFVSTDSVAVGVESRTSSPVRVVRDETSFASPSVTGLHPCGEGCGYAGGIVSAALDGLRVARAIAEAQAR